MFIILQWHTFMNSYLIIISLMWWVNKDFDKRGIFCWYFWWLFNWFPSRKVSVTVFSSAHMLFGNNRERVIFFLHVNAGWLGFMTFLAVGYLMPNPVCTYTYVSYVCVICKRIVCRLHYFGSLPLVGLVSYSEHSLSVRHRYPSSSVSWA